MMMDGDEGWAAHSIADAVAAPGPGTRTILVATVVRGQPRVIRMAVAAPPPPPAARPWAPPAAARRRT